MEHKTLNAQSVMKFQLNLKLLKDPQIHLKDPSLQTHHRDPNLLTHHKGHKAQILLKDHSPQIPQDLSKQTLQGLSNHYAPIIHPLKGLKLNLSLAQLNVPISQTQMWMSKMKLSSFQSLALLPWTAHPRNIAMLLEEFQRRLLTLETN